VKEANQKNQKERTSPAAAQERKEGWWGVVWIWSMHYMSKETYKYEKQTNKRDL